MNKFELFANCEIVGMIEKIKYTGDGRLVYHMYVNKNYVFKYFSSVII